MICQQHNAEEDAPVMREVLPAAGLSSLSFWLAAVETVADAAMTLPTTAVAVVAANSPC